jgi:hypothetical protein
MLWRWFVGFCLCLINFGFDWLYEAQSWAKLAVYSPWCYVAAENTTVMVGVCLCLLVWISKQPWFLYGAREAKQMDKIEMLRNRRRWGVCDSGDDGVVDDGLPWNSFSNCQGSWHTPGPSHTLTHWLESMALTKTCLPSCDWRTCVFSSTNRLWYVVLLVVYVLIHTHTLRPYPCTSCGHIWLKDCAGYIFLPSHLPRNG